MHLEAEAVVSSSQLPQKQTKQSGKERGEKRLSQGGGNWDKYW